jgi:zinc transport system substrate-binding protein
MTKNRNLKHRFAVLRRKVLTGVLWLAALLTVCGCRPSSSSTAQVAATTSYLESVALDVFGQDQSVLRLAEPGSCPGHFDIRPSQAASLRGCRALLRFDFQSSIDRVLENSGTSKPLVASVVVDGGLCEPSSYLFACRQVADACSVKGLLERTNAEARLAIVALRLAELARETTNRVARAGLRGAPVIASVHQRRFCEWLGLRVVAVFRAADSSSVAEIDDAIREGKLSDVKLVIANLPEGRRTADALAERLHARVVVLGNFPLSKNGRVSFDDLVADNAEELVRRAQP